MIQLFSKDLPREIKGLWGDGSTLDPLLPFHTERTRMLLCIWTWRKEAGQDCHALCRKGSLSPAGTWDCDLIPVTWLQVTPISGLLNLVQLTLLLHTEHTLSQEGPGWEGHRGAKPGNSKESRAFSQRGVSGTDVCSRQVLRSAKRLSWGSPGRGYPAESWILPLGCYAEGASASQPDIPLAAPAVPCCGLVFCSAKLCDLFKGAGRHALGAGLDSVCPYSMALAILQLNNQHTSGRQPVPLSEFWSTVHSGTHFKLSCPNECQIHIGEKKNHAGLSGGTVSFPLCNKDVQAPSKYSLLIILRLRDLFDC